MDWLFFSEIGLAGVGSGGLYALTGLALVLIYKATRVVNMAIGEILMFGAYVFMGFSAGLALPMWAAIPLAILVTGLMGGVIERLIIRPMLGESAISIFMVTIGLGSVLVGLVEIIWGANPQRLVEFMPSDPIFIGEAYLSSKVGYAFAIAAVVLGLFLIVFRTWRGGVALRATAGDQAAAYSMGINVPGVFSSVWVITAMISAGAGILVGSIGGISPNMGVYGLSVLVVVIVGGLDSLLGALIAGVLVGIIETYAGAYLGGEYKMLATFCLLVLVLVVRPYGLFGTHEIERL
ncbi:branched-chain amino acid ABC transporter permease [Terasakiella brassicae]|uniref:Branched-chain amino acid ABC transporter permease n=1 Tax=Terasakiella brassicae TaxID=1634917 RepID=A0A917BVU9_9PROT|nr:branched-chain amino acid ABC transporter permease [Terasakiella brassicae]GGF58259.1 branched-chain amino acid ABC transporter permease [Terasakiella brassicae]